MVDTGWVIAGAGTNDAGVGDTAWNNPERIMADDDSHANGNNAAKNAQMNYLVASDFGFAIPSTATIQGIEARFQAKDGRNANGTFIQVATRTHALIGKDSTTLSLDLETGSGAVTATPTDFDYGGPTELWGLSWTAAEINAPTFRALISMNASSYLSLVAGQPQVDAVWMKVYYSLNASGQNRFYFLG